MEKHITVVAALHIGFGIFGVLLCALIFFILVGSGIISGDEEALVILSSVASVVSIFLIVISVPGIIGGIGLLKRKNWARILVLIISAIDLLNIPIGTALGIYSIWTLVQQETVALFKV